LFCEQKIYIVQKELYAGTKEGNSNIARKIARKNALDRETQKSYNKNNKTLPEPALRHPEKENK